MIKAKRVSTGDIVVIVVCVLLILICLLPMLNVLARSLSAPEYIIRNEVMLLPKGLNFDSYTNVLNDKKTPRSLVWTAFITIIGTVLSMVLTTICAYPLTYDHLKGK